MSNKLKQIAAILANYDVRDPRATLRAIEQVVVAAESPVAIIKVFDDPGSKLFKRFEEAALKGRRKKDRA